jgi:D-tagatose-1,6-bisphosphate aldolase subunit GatZ/KbaZ
METVAVSRVEDLERTIDLHRAAFAAAGLEGVWERVIAVVVQPGVEFGHAQVIDYVDGRADALKTAIEAEGRLVFEAHSTDYQTGSALRALVASHFAILKVGPALTFALREAFFALAAIEAEWLPAEEQSNLRAVLDEAMLRNPTDWARYYHGSADEQAFARVWSLSDRSRYYWPEPSVTAVVARLIANLEAAPIPLPLLSQYLPVQHAAIRAGRLANAPRALIRAKVREVVQVYAEACGMAAASVAR